MPNTTYSAKRATGTALIVTGAGYLRGFMVSHAQTTAQTVTFYDSLTAGGTILMQFMVAKEQCPFYALWPRADAPVFGTGLAYAAANCEVTVWAVDTS